MLAGLSNAPQYLVTDSNAIERGCILSNDVDSVIVPIDACAGKGLLSFAQKKCRKVWTELEYAFSCSSKDFKFFC